MSTSILGHNFLAKFRDFSLLTLFKNLKLINSKTKIIFNGARAILNGANANIKKNY